MQLTGLYQQIITEERRQGHPEGRKEGQQAEAARPLNMLSLRFGTIDTQLQAVIEPLMALPSTA